MRDEELSPEDREVVDWITRHSRPLYDLTGVMAMRDMLDALATRLDGKSAAATVPQASWQERGPVVQIPPVLVGMLRRHTV